MNWTSCLLTSSLYLLCGLSAAPRFAESMELEPSGHGGHGVMLEHVRPIDIPKSKPSAIADAKAPAADHQKMHHETGPGIEPANKVIADPHAGHVMKPTPTTPAEPMDHKQHGSIPMQDGSAPADGRDPHAYAEGHGYGPIPPPIMADEEIFAALIADRLESLTTRDRTYLTYDWQAWLGKTYNRALIRAEGDIDDGRFQNARTELLWAHAADANWDLHLGGRYDTGFGPDRGWFAVGVQGMAPYWIYVEATAYVGEEGRTAFRIETEYDILLTQRLILQPRMEANFYGKRDEARALGHGLSDLSLGVRLHYEIRRELAPYIGVEWSGKFGDTADYLRASHGRADEMRAVAGVQFWY